MQPCRVFASVCAVLALAAPVGASSPGSPNIIFILADDLGWGDLGVNGQNDRAAAGLPAMATPNIDALAAKSLSFTRMYSTPLCSPSRASLLTGYELHNLKRDTTDGGEGLRPGNQDKTWAQSLQENGYKTAMYGKWHIGGLDWPGSGVIYDPNSIPTQKGFEIAFGSMGGGFRTAKLWENDGAGSMKLVDNKPQPDWPGPGLPYQFHDDAITDRVVKLVHDSQTDARPFAAYVAIQAPHEPLNQVPLGEYANRPWPDVHKQYAAMMANLDQNVGRIVAAVEDPNNDGDKSDSIASNTIIMFASDNGALWNHSNGYLTEYFDSNGQFRGQKSNTLEGGIRTPFFVRWDGVTSPGSVNDSRVGSLADIYPTFAELVGDKPPVGLDGVSMLSAITGDGPAREQDAHVWTARWNFVNQQSWAVQMGGWKLIRRFSNMTHELYNIANDPSESTNLASSRADIRDALAALVALEGVTDEPYFANGNNGAPGNVYYTQYKTWAPQDGSTTFNLAANWAGGTQFNRAGDGESLYWNTGPKKNWIATVSNSVGGFRNSFALNHLQVLGLEVVGGAGTMQLSVQPGAQLDAYNGVRVGQGGMVRLFDGTLATAREVDIEAGGALVGKGLVTGFQHLVAGIPEFQGKKLLSPEVFNAGTVDPYSETAAGLITINGDFAQWATGEFRVDLLGAGGAPGVDFDKLAITGDATLGGAIYVDVAAGFSPADGQLFPILSAASIQLAGLQLTGPDASQFTFSIVGGANLVLVAGQPSGDFDGNGMVDAADLAVWGQNYGQAGSPGFGNNDGVVDGMDFLWWQRQYGAASPPISPATAAVPEPASLALVAACLPLVRRLRRARNAR